ncbi:MAG: nucleotide exchange factor GrpE [Gemmatimonadota bacterium]
MTDKTRFSGNIDSGSEPIHTPGGMAEPASDDGPSADGADLASTDTSQLPSSRTEDTQPLFGEGRTPHLENEMQEIKDRHLRLAAEFDNYKKRVARERSELTDRAQATFIGRLLDVLDDLDRLVAMDASVTAESLRGGLALVDKKLRKELEAAGVERIDPAGQAFDPAQHEAVSIVSPPDPSQDHTVATTFQTGYRFKGNLVRPARVQVYSEQGQA